MDDRSHRIERILAERLRRARSGIVHVDEPTAPLSHVQQSLWILSQLAGNRPTAHRPLSLSVGGELDVDALAAALGAVVRRHAVLRTTFPTDGPEPIQRVEAPGPVDLPVVDVSGDPDPATAARREAERHFRRPFDLTREVPFRPLLIRRGPSDHLLAVSLHHIVFDGWSERIFVNELVAHYDAAVEGRTSADLPTPTIGFADFARWERSQIDEERIAADLAYWRRRLADLPPDLDLPPDRRPAGDVEPVSARVPVELTRRLEALATSNRATLFMTLLAALQVLVARHSGQDDVLVGVPTAGRPLPETEPLIGCFINTVVIRADLAGNPPFTAVLDQARTATLEALDHARAPFGRVFGEIRPWTPDRVPLYRVSFQLRNFPEPFRRSVHLDVTVTDEAPSPGDHLTLRAARNDDGVALTFGYDPTRFRRDTIERWAGHYLTLLEAVAEDPTSGIRDHVLLTATERRRVVVDFNDGATRPEGPRTLVADRVRQVAARLPDATAVEDGEERVSFRDLDLMVDRVAAALVERNLDGEDRVVVYADRSIPTIAGILGALRAGVAYIPVDADLATAWLGTVVAQARPSLILTRPWLVPATASLGVEVAVLDDLVDGPACAPVEGRARPEDVAYILYTSGSTGPPKGVLVEQRNLASFLDSMAAVRPLGPDDRVMLFHSISFDAVASNLHAPLAFGACVVVRDEDAVASIPRLLRWLDRRRITVMSLPTGMFHALAEEMVKTDTEFPPRLRLIFFGGEQARADVVGRWLRRFGDRVVLHNSYGPTETTVFVAWHEFGADDLALDWVPIGRPVPGTAIYVLDDRGRPTPIGVRGEIYVSGPLVARGYLEAPELTNARFLADPFRPGERMYRTGDIGRWLPDGTLETLGRVDRQVKVRGFRVEPGEIEATLRSFDDVEDAAVVPAETADGTRALHAYIVGTADPLEVHARLRTRLPSFLVPATVTPVETLPVNVAGKLDVHSLPDPLRPEPVSRRRSGLGPAEEVAATWREVLGLDAVDPDSSFFSLGGHSLLALRLLSRLRNRLGCEVPLTVLFEHPTLRLFTAAVEALVTGQGSDGSVGAAEPAPSTNPPPVSSGLAAADVATLLKEIEQLTDEEAEALLARLDEEPT